MAAHRYDRQGLLALEPSAFFSLFFAPPSRENEQAGDAAIVLVRGPLEAHRGGWCDSYEEIVARVSAACASPAKAVVLRIDSPGGDVAGMLDAAEAIRAKCAAAGKRLLAYIDGRACSAAYALACTAESIIVEPSAIVGSIGIINARVDATAQAAAWGLKVALVTSGAHKANGHPQAPITEAELAETQSIVDALAGTFFEQVGAARGLAPDAIAALEARVFAGADAVTAGLADKVGTFDSVLAMASADAAATAAGKGANMDEAKKALQAVIDDEKASDDEKAKAKKALAAMDDSDEKESKAEGDEDEKKDEDEEAKASARVGAPQAAAPAPNLKAVEKLVEQKLRARDEAAERDRLIASRPDLDEQTRALLASAPLAQVRDYVEKAPRKALKPAATAVVGGVTRAEGQGEPGQRSDQKRQLDVLMGRAEGERAPHFEGKRQVFPVMNRAQRAKYLEARTKAAQTA